MSSAILFGMGPITFIALISMSVALMITLVNKFAIDQNVMKEMKKDIAKYRSEMKANRGDLEKIKKIQPKMMEISMKQMKMSFKPMMYYFIPIILVFTWMKSVLVDVVVLPLSFWPGHLGWLGTYIIFSIVFSTFFRKALKVH